MMQFIDTSLAPLVWTVAAVVLTLIYYKIRNRGIFPGPSGLPYMGIWPFLKEEKFYLQLTDYGRKYGDIYSFTFTGKLFIHLGSVKAIREVHVNHSEYFAGRFGDMNVLTYTIGNGLAMVNGERWKELRKFFLQNFKEYGVTAARDGTLGPIYDSLSAMIEDLKARKNKPFNILDILNDRCQVSLQKILFGENGISDEKLQCHNNAYFSVLEGFAGLRMLLIGPVARILFAIWPKFRKALANREIMYDTLRESLKKMDSSFNEDYPSCIIENYFKERKERRRKNDPTWKYFTDEALIESLSQFCGDGIIGTAALIGNFLTALIEHPEEQDKIYDEIVKVIGSNRLPTMGDKSKLSYTNAFMNEVLRTSVFFPVFPSLECTKETTIRGYRIPKGSITLLNFWSAHHDPATYEDPEKFNPRRFLPEPGKARSELPVTFGIGKRSCSGEGFVMMEAFLFLTTIVQNFHISYPNDPTGNACTHLPSDQIRICVRPRAGV